MQGFAPTVLKSFKLETAAHYDPRFLSGCRLLAICILAQASVILHALDSFYSDPFTTRTSC